VKLLHVRLEGWTATFRLPLLYSGTGLTSPLPPYSTLLGLMGSLAGHEIAAGEIRSIGFVFASEGVAVDLETTWCFEADRQTGRLKSKTQRGIAKRQFHVRPKLDLYLDNLNLLAIFEHPANPPCLGRSQDLAWIVGNPEEVEATPVEEGIVRGTLLPFPEPNAGGLILRLPDYFDNSDLGYTRSIEKLAIYQAIKHDAPARIRRAGLFSITGLPNDEAIYVHSLMPS